MKDQSFNKERILALIKKNEFANFIGLHLEQLKYGRFLGKLLIHQHHKQQRGLLHGGVISTLMDIAMGFAAYTVVRESQHVVTANLDVSYFSPTDEGWILVDGKVEKSGNTLVFCEGVVTAQNDNRILAKGRSCMAILQK
jgi:uncharacterized protein (TIGR00369 family)